MTLPSVSELSVHPNDAMIQHKYIHESCSLITFGFGGKRNLLLPTSKEKQIKPHKKKNPKNLKQCEKQDN